MSADGRDLSQNKANYTPLSPLSFLKRTAAVYPDRTALVYGQLKRDWRSVYVRCTRLADSLRKLGLKPGETVAVLSANTPEMFELHFAVAMAGGVLNAINIRLDPASIAFILEHGEARIFMLDSGLGHVGKKALALLDKPPVCVDIPDTQAGLNSLTGSVTYDDLVADGSEQSEWLHPEDEWDAIALNYTSGTTGNPKGVVYHHRGAYLNAVSNALVWNMGPHPVYLWTLPMFHCNGWCFPWTLAMNAGTSVCLREMVPEKVFQLIDDHRVTHFCGAPIVMNMLIAAATRLQKKLKHSVNAMTAGAAPPEAVIRQMEDMGVHLTHTYGLTETYGPVTLCAPQEQWSSLKPDERAKIQARQGVKGHMLEDLMVANPNTLEPVALNGEEMGEVFMRGNNVMKGYLKNPSGTEQAFGDGWFHSGDLAVWHADGYIQILDRSKDLIISGGENISSLEIEDVLYKHPNVFEVAVVARSHPKWGEAPCAFIALTEGADETEQSIVAYCRENMARFKIPKTVVFCELPKTSTGKIQKFMLRKQAEELKREPLP